MSSKAPWIQAMNEYGANNIPFIFILDYELKNNLIYKLSEIPIDIYYKFNDVKNYTLSGVKNKALHFEISPINIDRYRLSFDSVKQEILFGNSFLLNLTFPTLVKTNYSLQELFEVSHAKYKLFFKNTFIVSSPENFVKIKEGKIFTYPMKGTIDASIDDAASKILNDVKETAEHYTIVDLLRNDLSKVANHVKVNKFRYIDILHTTNKTLLQVSSEIEGQLPADHLSHLGDIFADLLPAGSITGAPKKKTVDIINENEVDERGYFTGVFGIFDGQQVDSAVMIRFIEDKHGLLYYRSGGGITAQSDCMEEYKEMIDKVYVPLGRKY